MTRNTGDDERLRSAFISDACTEVRNSSAVSHPYLRALRDGDVPDIRIALQDFALQYGLYSAQFVRYMSAVLNNVAASDHKNILLENLAEENGATHDVDLPPGVLDSIAGIPHAQLFRRFQLALDSENASFVATETCPGRIWAREFLALCKTNECVGVGAIGIGTELIVASIYNQILAGIKVHSDLTQTEHVFFDLHSVCDDEHAAQMMHITKSLAVDDDSRAQIMLGIRSAIKLRSAFWDAMLDRAHELAEIDARPAERTSALGHQKSL